MQRISLRVVLACWLVFLAAASYVPVRAQTPDPELIPGPELVIYADTQPSTLRIPAPDFGAQLNSTSIQVTFLGSSSGCETFPAQAQTAYLYAVNIWSNYLSSSIPIQISACWRDLGSANILGSAGPAYIVRNFLHAPLSETYYPLALANSLAGSDLISGGYEISSNFNSIFSGWYFGTDGDTPSNQWDFTSVVLHEIGHGLGFSGGARVSGGSLYFVAPPYIYDRFTENTGGTSLLSLDPASLTAALTSGTYFDGPNADAANGGNRVQLYTPSTWQSGSSYSHMAEIFNGTPNALMTYSLSNGEAVHDPGPVVMGILKDIGWSISIAPPSAPSGLSAVVDSGTPNSRINLTWSDNSSDETGFEIYRSTDNSNWTLVTTTAANTTSYPNSGLLSGTRYYYRVRAVNGMGASGYTTGNAVTGGAAQAPSGLSALPVGETSILLTWTDNSNVETFYELQRSPNGSNGWVTVSSTIPANTTRYTNTGLVKSTPYYYQVRAIYATPSIYSAKANATTWSTTLRLFLPAALK
jgi:hypothetical protein